MKILSTQEILDNVITLSAPYLNMSQDIDEAVLKSAYRTWLNTIQPYCPLMNADELFYASVEVEDQFCDYFAEESRIEEVEYRNHKILYPDPLNRKEVLMQAFDYLEKQDPEWANLFKLIMNTVFCSVSKRLGGTSVNPSYIGVMCAHYDMYAEKMAVPELLIHEFAHNALFLDEHRYRYYQKVTDLSKPETYVDSLYYDAPIRLPFDRVLHRLVIFIEVLEARNNYLGHQATQSQHLPSDEMVKIACWYIEQIQGNSAIQQILTERGLDIMQRITHYFHCALLRS